MPRHQDEPLTEAMTAYRKTLEKVAAALPASKAWGVAGFEELRWCSSSPRLCARTDGAP